MNKQLSKIYQISRQHPDADVIKIASMYIRRGGIIIYPTDTLYGFGVDAHNSVAMARLYKIKGMDRSKPVSMLVRDVDHIEEIIGPLNATEKGIVEKLTPGKVTIILPIKRRSALTALQNVKKIGFRIPDCEVCRMLVLYSKTALSSTSVNISKSGNIFDVSEIQNQFRDRVDIILDAGSISSLGSSIIDTTTTPPTLLREGDLTREEIEKKLGSKLRAADECKFHIIFVCSGNICRSPTAAGILRQMIGRTKYKLYVDVSSAGTLPYSGASASEWSIAVARESGVDISDHTSQPINDKLMEHAHLIICMALNHYKVLSQNYPQFRSKIVLLKQWRVGTNLTNPSIADPIGHSLTFYEKTYAEILKEIKRVFPEIIKLVKSFIREQGIDI